MENVPATSEQCTAQLLMALAMGQGEINVAALTPATRLSA